MQYNNKKLYRTFFLSFGLLALLSLFGFLFVNILIDQQEKNTKLINLSGKQRMYTVRVMLYAATYCDRQDDDSLEQLGHYLTQMKVDNDYINEVIHTTSVQDIYHKKAGIHDEIQTFFTQAQSFVQHPSRQNLKELSNIGERLIIVLDQAVSAFENENVALSQTLQRRQFFIFMAIIVLLIFEAFFLVKPVIRFIGNYTHELEETVKKRTKKYRLYANIFKNATEGVMITDPDLKIIDVNEGFRNITGYTRESILGKTPAVLKSGLHKKAFYKTMWHDIDTTGHWNGKLINRHYDGHNYHETLSIIKLYDDDHHLTNYIGVFSDISTLVKNEEEMRYLATHDTLTGLPNRYHLTESIDHAISIAERNESLIAVVFIDLDNFKIINDSMGHQVGDKFLIEIAKRLKESVRKSDTVARIGGDEFVILLESIPSESDMKVLLEKILHNIRTKFTYENYKFSPSGSLGIAFSKKHHNCNAANLLRRADLAMYQAKELGKNQIIYYNETLEEKAQYYLQVETQLRDAIKNRELELYFQPKVNLESRAVIGAEILLRWEQDGQMLSPESFIPIAEESHLIIEVDKWVCEETINILKAWKARGMQQLLFSINISARTFSHTEAMDEIIKMIVQSGFAKHIDLEITESVLIQNFSTALYTLDTLSNYGISTSLDDFGTAYSSFSYLSKLPFNAIKIDRSFIMDLQMDEVKDERQKVLINAMITFSKQLGMKVIAEGVETEEQLEWLLHHQCDEGQGYYFSKPIKLEAFELFISMQNMHSEQVRL